jgi:hypothetical protein
MILIGSWYLKLNLVKKVIIFSMDAKIYFCLSQEAKMKKAWFIVICFLLFFAASGTGLQDTVKQGAGISPQKNLG